MIIDYQQHSRKVDLVQTSNDIKTNGRLLIEDHFCDIKGTIQRLIGIWLDHLDNKVSLALQGVQLIKFLIPRYKIVQHVKKNVKKNYPQINH